MGSADPKSEVANGWRNSGCSGQPQQPSRRAPATSLSVIFSSCGRSGMGPPQDQHGGVAERIGGQLVGGQLVDSGVATSFSAGHFSPASLSFPTGPPFGSIHKNPRASYPKPDNHHRPDIHRGGVQRHRRKGFRRVALERSLAAIRSAQGHPPAVQAGRRITGVGRQSQRPHHRRSPRSLDLRRCRRIEAHCCQRRDAEARDRRATILGLGCGGRAEGMQAYPHDCAKHIGWFLQAARISNSAGSRAGSPPFQKARHHV